MKCPEGQIFPHVGMLKDLMPNDTSKQRPKKALEELVAARSAFRHEIAERRRTEGLDIAASLAAPGSGDA